jgi:iron complex outermembrane receptor protein
MSLSSSKAQVLALQLAIAALCVGVPTMPSTAASADAASAEAPESGGLDEVIVTGTRQSGQLAADSPAPIQILSAEALQNGV